MTSKEKDSLIIQQALAYSYPEPLILMKMLLKEKEWRVSFHLAIQLFKSTTKYKEGTRYYKVKLNAVRDKFIKDYLEQLTIKKIISNNVIVTSLKYYNAEPCLWTARYKFLKGRARFATQATRNLYDRTGEEPYSLHL